jgi:sulfate adenylyltransferase subunit 1 (EFTu-like GTPase family)
VRVRLGEPIAADPYAACRATGAFVLIDEGTKRHRGGGMVEA